MLKEYLADNSPEIDLKDPQVQEAIKKLLSNKEFMEKVEQMAKQNPGQPGSPPKYTKEEIAKLLESMPKENLPSGLDLPQDPRTKNTPPNNKQTNDTKQNIDGPGPKLTEPKKLTRPPAPLGSKDDPKGAVKPMPIGEQPMPDPFKQGPIVDQGKGNPFQMENNPFGQPDVPNDPRSKSMSALATLWERNIGPLDETPEVKRAIFDLVSGENGFDFDFKDEQGNSFWDLLKNEKGDDSPFSDFLKDSGESNNNWNWSKFDAPEIGWSKWFSNSPPSGGHSNPSSSTPHLPESSSSGWGLNGSGGIGGLSGSWFTVVILGLVVLGAFLLWWFLRDAKATESLALGKGLGPWPIDPRSINSREDVVKAFEYLSVLICGTAAKMWTHGTIAEALTNLAVTQGEIAVKLARLYELARYAPLDEPLTRLEVIEARQIVCDLAEVT